jgi:esterase/lipase superfamily enzyme
MSWREIKLDSWAIGQTRLVVHGHWGRPLLMFPSDSGYAHDFQNHGLLHAVHDLVDAGRVKIYCVDSYDSQSWRREDVPREERARAHQKFEDFVVNDVLPAIREDCGGRQDVLLGGCSFGGFHAANFVLRRADLFQQAICLSGAYDMSRIGWGERGDAFYFSNPMDYVANMTGDHLDWIRSRVFLLLVCGQGAWEDDSASGALPSTLRFAQLLGEKGIPHELRLWGHDIPHDWPSWCWQLATYLPRFC